MLNFLKVAFMIAFMIIALLVIVPEVIPLGLIWLVVRVVKKRRQSINPG